MRRRKLLTVSVIPVAATLGMFSACDRQEVPLTGPVIGGFPTPTAVITGANVLVLPIVADALNDRGQAAGSRFVWTPNQGLQDIGTLGGVSTVANAINNVGQVAGASFTPLNHAWHAFLWTPGVGMQDLGTLGGKDSQANGMNDRGQVVGESSTASGATHAFLWSPGQGMRDLGTLGGASIHSRANAVNNAGVVVGESYDGSGPVEVSARATVWMPGGAVKDLGTLGGRVSLAHDVNDLGQIVGESSTPSESNRAFLWTPAKGMRDLGTLGGLTSRARHVNSAGQVVGSAQTAIGLSHAFLWTAADGMEDLYAATGILVASAINAQHQVLGGNRLAALQLTFTNHAPLASSAGPYTGIEGSAVALAFSATDADGDALSYSWDFGDGVTGSGSVPPAAHVYADNGTYDVRLAVMDGKGGSDATTTAATIANAAPAIAGGGLTAPAAPIRLLEGSVTVPITVAFTDPAGPLDTYTAEIQCGNGAELQGAGITSPYAAVCTYRSAGVYTVSATVSDEDGGRSAPAFYRYVVVYDPDGGFTTGGGFFPVAGKGKAHFTFTARFLPRRPTPNGNVRFWIPGQGFNFESTGVDMLIVSGRRAQFWGVGTLNGAPARFRVTVVDGRAGSEASAGAVRIELWQAGRLVFDTQPGALQDAPVTTEIEGGSIEVHGE